MAQHQPNQHTQNQTRSGRGFAGWEDDKQREAASKGGQSQGQKK
jgi:hypothetical protein